MPTKHLLTTTSPKAWLLAALGVMGLTTPSALAYHSYETDKNFTTRGGAIEFYLPFTLFTAPTMTVDNVLVPDVGTFSSVMEFAHTNLFGIGGGYGLSDHFNLNFQVNFGNVDYAMHWGPYSLKGTGQLRESKFNVDYYFLKGKFTPFITAGMGYTMFESNIPNGTSDINIWWDPWWGYVAVSGGTPQTHSIGETTANAGVGIRWEANEYIFVKALFDVTWMHAGKSGLQEFPEFQLQIGVKL